MADGFYTEGANLYGNTDKTVGPTLPLGFNGGVVVGADANTVLTTSSGRRIIVTPTANRDYTLPTGVLEKLGDTWTFINLATAFSVVLKASDATTIATVQPGQTKQVFAKQDNPTTNTHWQVIGVFGTEYLEQTQTASQAETTGVVSNLTASPLSLSAGDWDITLVAYYAVSAGAAALQAGISTVSATFQGSAGIQYVMLNNVGIGEQVITLPSFRVTPAATTDYYAVNVGTYGGTCVSNCRISARRAGT